MNDSRIGAALEEGFGRGWFTGCQAAFVEGARIRLFAGGRTGEGESAPVGDGTLFDLASLTKSLVALGLAGPIADGAVGLERRIGDTLAAVRRGPLAEVTPGALLGHRSGLPAYLPWERGFAPREDASVRGRIVRGEGKAYARDRALSLIPVDPGTVVYSDIGYLLVQVVLEEGLGLGLPALIDGGALTGGAGLRYLPVGDPVPGDVAATGWCDWRGRTLAGEVNDPRAYLVGGIAAWAGLFGTARGLGTIAVRILDLWGTGGARAEALQLLVAGDDATRRGGFGYGFMLPTPGRSLGGSAIPPTAFGHVGFTGTSWWIDPPSGRAAVLLTNLTLPPEARGGYNTWRRDLHDLFWKET